MTIMKAWIDFPIILPKQNTGYIYKLLNEQGKVVYIGSTKNILQRISSHLFSDKIFSAVQFLECPLEEMEIWETEMILDINPKYNNTIPANDKYKHYESYKKLNPLVKGKLIKLKKALKKIAAIGRGGYYDIKDLDLAASLVIGGEI